jgi:ABC-type nitrate/sulfonate/bicarbonate transport system permease component
LADISDFGIAIAAFIGLTLAVGIISSKLIKKSGRRLIVAGKSLPLALVGTMLAGWKLVFR